MRLHPHIAKCVDTLAHPHVVFFALPWLMVLLVIGTLAQKEMGLYLAHQTYFAAWIVWLGPLPVPGTYPTLGLITLSLAIKFIFKSPLNFAYSGTWLTHLGILILLLGGLVTAATQREGFMVIEEGGQTQIISDYHHRVLHIYKDDVLTAELDVADLVKDQTLPIDSFNAQITDLCANCLPAFVDPSEDRKGIAAKVKLTQIPMEPEHEINLAGLTLEVSQAGTQADGIYILMEEMSKEISFTQSDHTYRLTIGRAMRPLPFTVALTDFKKTLHPATNMAKSYHSDVIVKDEEIEWPARIEMNEPLRYKGYTLYQSSFSQSPDGTERTVLSVVENKGRLFPYLASVVIALGLLLHLIVRVKPAARALIYISLLGGLMMPFNNAHAETKEFSYMDFRTLPVLHQGRVKPLDSFARANLTILRGSENIDGMHATSWLAQTLFDPASAVHVPVFRVFKAHKLGLAEKDTPYYSYAELAPALQKKIPLIKDILETDEKSWGADQQTLIDLHEASIIYTQLLRSFSGLLPLSVSLPESLVKDWNIKPDQLQSLRDFKRYEQRLKNRVKKILKEKGDNPSAYTQDEKEIAAFAYSLFVIEQAGAQNMILRILPGLVEQAGGQWFSPWAIEQSGMGSPQSAAYLKLWTDMMNAYRAGNPENWAQTANETRTFIEALGPAFPTLGYTPADASLEVLYKKTHPLGLAMILCVAAFLLTLWRDTHKSIYISSFSLLALAVFLNIAALAFRVMILDRPPVGTLYESVIFVSALCGVIALLFEYKYKDGLGLIIGALSTGLLLFVAGSFSGPDDKQVLVAVLNTNFWLTTHVLCITAGYAWCVIAALAAHYYLFARWRAKTPPQILTNLIAHTKTLALISLLFTAVGTILGGIWADQSWGRFWGWDPKENGALLIVLWLIWLVHAQVSNHLGPLAFMAGMAFLNVIVAIAWFGVNLLSTGLHSYGFIEGVAGGLATFIAIEMIFIGLAWILILRQEKPYHEA